MNKTKDVSLVETRKKNWENPEKMHQYIDDICDRIDSVNSDVVALTPECERKKRLQNRVDSLQKKHSTSNNPLFGIPIGVKDVIHVDGFTTRAGTALPPELFQGSEAPVVSKIKEAGGLILKAETTEFAGSGPSQTRNPHDLKYSPGGSSSGSAAAVAAGLCPLAVGTQTGGSVIRPASFCGVAGFKPSFDRISTDGVITRSESLDHVGLFTQDMKDMEVAASAIIDDWNDEKVNTDPTLAIPTGPYLDQVSPEARSKFQDYVEILKKSGYDIKEVDMFEDFHDIDNRRHTLSLGELALNFDDFYENYKLFLRYKIIERLERGQKVTTKELADARSLPNDLYERIEDTMETEDIDIWISPSALGTAPKGISTTGDSAMNRIWTAAGLPAITIPAGSIDGLPMGLQCVCKYDLDEKLLQWGIEMSSKFN